MDTKVTQSGPDRLSGPRYWKSLDDLASTPAFREWLEREFPEGASEIDGVNRRSFLKVMAASFGLAGLGMAGCRRPEQFIMPYSEQPENIIPGLPVYYSTSMPGAEDSIPLVVETHQARPTKIEGNPGFKAYGGATDTFTQASVLDLYDPDRATRSVAGGSTVAPAAVRDRLTAIRGRHTANRGKGLVFLAEPSTSPTREALVARLRDEFPQALWAEYSPTGYDNAARATEAVFGKRLRPAPRFGKARRVLSIDSDFVNSGAGKLGHCRAFAATRKVRDRTEAKQMSRLYSVEANLTLTGSMADHRLRLGSSQMGAFTALLGAEVLERSGRGGTLARELRGAAGDLEVDPHWIGECANDLVAHAAKHESLVVAGEHLPPSVHAIVLAVNQALGAPGHTIAYLDAGPAGPAAGIAEAAERLAAGAVESLVIIGGNPVYDAPAELDWRALQQKAVTSVHLSDSYNETSALAKLVIARSHYLESWGDGRTFDGTLVPVQPMIEPLFPTFNELEVLARLAGAGNPDPYGLVLENFNRIGGASFEKFLSAGLLAGTYPEVGTPVDYAAVASAVDSAEIAAPVLSADNLEALFAPSSHSLDGRFLNNGWLMETPDPLTKLTWDNAILISPRLARELEERDGVQIFPSPTVLTRSDSPFQAVAGEQQLNKGIFKRGKEMAPVATLTVGGREVTGPVHVLPGLANYSVVLPLGFGRTVVGRVGDGAGFDAYKVRTSGSMACALGAALKLTRETYRLANTQEHWSMEGRAIIREATAADYAEHPDFVDRMGVEAHSPPIFGKSQDKSLQYKVLNQPRGNSAHEIPRFADPPSNVGIWKGKEDRFPVAQQWGMAIDLNTCTGCNACVVACTSENNIPVIGKDQVLRGREMHWIRLDRYFSGAELDNGTVPEDVQVSFMGMACQHCENAPCESVCPVNATVHDSQGLNVMAYNRCVGTRYCANNCPYKVRRFNFFDWNKRVDGAYYKGPLGPVDEPELGKMQKNPNVTVRMRGVMEKCTYCVQRIEMAKHDQKRKAADSDNIRVPDGRIVTACQQACPTDAIVFGDVSDTTTEVYAMKQNDRDYSVLGYLNNRPRTTFLARLRNPNPAMPDAFLQPHSRRAYEHRYGHGAHGDDHSGAPAGEHH